MASTSARQEEAHQPMDKRVLGYLVVGFASLIGGVFIFMFIVVPQRQPETGVPRDVQMIFTEVFSNQNLVKTETGHYTPALITLEVDQATCRQYECLLTLNKEANDYTFRLTKDGQTWAINSHSPVPEGVK